MKMASSLNHNSQSDTQHSCQNTDLVQKPPPTFSTLFRPGNYLINREIMMCLDHHDLSNLRQAAKDIDNDLYSNLEHVTTPQWVCQTRDASVICHGSHIKCCEGFEMGSWYGITHGPNHGICEHCAAMYRKDFPIHGVVEDGPSGISELDVLDVPFKRVDKTASRPKHACACSRAYSKRHLCAHCRVELVQDYQMSAFKEVQAEPAEDLEFITTADPPLNAHLIKRNQTQCSACREEYDRCDRNLDSYLEQQLIKGAPIHFTEEPPQIFQCLVCAGGMRGYVVVGEEGRGDHTPFGVGRQIQQDLPWT